MLRNRIKFGVALNYTPELIVNSDWIGLKSIALECEMMGYDSIWVMDHFTDDVRNLPSVMECYTTLGALAAVTSKIRLGCLVTCNSYRHPPLVAKIAATLDVISNGRFEYGIGAGWKEDEYLMYGIEFPSAFVRIQQLREAVQVVKKMWTESGTTFRGKYYRIENMDFGPKPVQKPHPPVWIGGRGEKYLLRVAAELADVVNLGYGFSLQEYLYKMKVLEKHCRAVGRDYNEIGKSVSLEVHIGSSQEEARKKMLDWNQERPVWQFHKAPDPSRRLVGTPEQCVSQLEKWVSHGVEFVLVGWSMNIDDWKIFAEQVIPSFR